MTSISGGQTATYTYIILVGDNRLTSISGGQTATYTYIILLGDNGLGDRVSTRLRQSTTSLRKRKSPVSNSPPTVPLAPASPLNQLSKPNRFSYRSGIIRCR